MKKHGQTWVLHNAWMVGGFNSSETYESQLGLLSQYIGKNMFQTTNQMGLSVYLFRKTRHKKNPLKHEKFPKKYTPGQNAGAPFAKSDKTALSEQNVLPLRRTLLQQCGAPTRQPKLRSGRHANWRVRHQLRAGSCGHRSHQCLQGMRRWVLIRSRRLIGTLCHHWVFCKVSGSLTTCVMAGSLIPNCFHSRERSKHI